MIMGLKCLKMRRWSGIGVVACLFVFLVLRYAAVENSLAGVLVSNPLFHNASDYLRWRSEAGPPPAQNPAAGSKLISTRQIVSALFAKRNFSEEEQRSLQTWSRFRHFVDHPGGLPNAMEAIQEAASTWGSLVDEVLEEKRLGAANGTQKTREKQCPYSITRMELSGLNGSSFRLKIPCGLVQGSSVTVIGTPAGLLGDFRIDLMGAALPGDPEPPIVLHCNVRLMGDKNTDEPVIVQNTWTPANDWGPEERCPSAAPDDQKGARLPSSPTAPPRLPFLAPRESRLCLLASSAPPLRSGRSGQVQPGGGPRRAADAHAEERFRGVEGALRAQKSAQAGAFLPVQAGAPGDRHSASRRGRDPDDRRREAHDFLCLPRGTSASCSLWFAHNSWVDP